MTIAKSLIREMEAGFLKATHVREWMEREGERLNGEEKAAVLAKIVEREALETKAPDSLFDILPAGWLRDYLKYCQLSEAPDSFHLACGLAALSHKVGRRMRYSLGTGSIFPPLSVFLVSPAGMARRSESIDTMLPIARDSGVVILDGVASPEGLVAWLADEPETMLVGDEASGLLNRVEYMRDMVRVLIQAIDLRPLRRKLRKEMIEADPRVFNVVIGCARSWFKTMPDALVEGGLMSRFLPVYEPTRQREHPFPYKLAGASAILGMREQLGRDLEAATVQAGGDVTFAPAAEKLWEEFYTKNGLEMRRRVDERLGPYFSRKPAHAIRIAMALLASGGKGAEIGQEELVVAFALLAKVEEGLMEVYDSLDIGSFKKVKDRIMRIMERSGGRVKHSVMLGRVSDLMDADTLKKAMITLDEMGYVKIHAELSGRWYELLK